MNKFCSYLAAGCMAVASLASCSRSNYAFQPSTSAYHGTVARTEAPATKAATVEATTVEAPAENLTASVEAAPVASKRSAVAVAAARTATAKAVVAKAEKAQASGATAAVTKAERKAVKLAVKEAKKDVKKQDEGGKNQLVALLLAILLGGLGIHRFYLGYTGRGILHIALALTSFLIVPAIVNLVLVIIDVVKIATGSLKPKGGADYGKKL